MRAFALILILVLPLSAKKKKAAGPDPTTDVGLVQLFLKVNTNRLPVSEIPRFIDINALKLPRKLRAPFRAKRAELLALKNINDGKTKPPIRRAGKEPEDECSGEEVEPEMSKQMGKMGFGQIYDDEVTHLEKVTKCTQCELVEEWTLKVYIVPPQGKSKHATRYFFLHKKDPLWTKVAEYRNGGSGGTNFFSIGFAGACR